MNQEENDEAVGSVSSHQCLHDPQPLGYYWCRALLVFGLLFSVAMRVGGKWGIRCFLFGRELWVPVPVEGFFNPGPSPCVQEGLATSSLHSSLLSGRSRMFLSLDVSQGGSPSESVSKGER